MQAAVWLYLAIFVGGGIAYAFQARRPKGAKPRLNVWYRTALVLTVIGLLVCLLWRAQEHVDWAIEGISGRYRLCLDFHDRDCAAEMTRSFSSAIPTAWRNAALETGLLIAGAWILAYIALWTTRWILKGRPA